LPDFSVSLPDFSVSLPDVSVSLPEFYVQLPDGSLKWSDFGFKNELGFKKINTGYVRGSVRIS